MTVDVSYVGLETAGMIQVSGVRLEPGEPPVPEVGNIRVAHVYLAPDPEFSPPTTPGIIMAQWDGERLVRQSGIGVWDGAEIVRQDQ